MIVQTKGKLNALGFNSPRMIEELRKAGIKVKTDKLTGQVSRIGWNPFLSNILLKEAIDVKEKTDVRTVVDKAAKEIEFMAGIKKEMNSMENTTMQYRSYHATVASMNLDGIEKSAKSGGYAVLIEKELDEVKQIVNDILGKVGKYSVVA